MALDRHTLEVVLRWFKMRRGLHYIMRADEVMDEKIESHLSRPERVE